MSAFIAALLVVAALPEYHPAQHVSGTVRVSGNDQMAALLQRWEKGFRRFHPDVRFESWLKGTASGIYGLEMRTADLVLMGRAMNPFEYYWTRSKSLPAASPRPTSRRRTPSSCIATIRSRN